MCSIILHMAGKLIGYLSVRSVPPHLERKLIAESRKRHLSKSRVAIEALEEGLSRPKTEKSRRRIRQLAGFFSRDEVKQLERQLASQRTIEPEPWQ